MKAYQILIMRKGETRWTFAAHGAAFSAEEAETYKAVIAERGGRVKLLPVKP